jgi:hypothetical protein
MTTSAIDGLAAFLRGDSIAPSVIGLTPERLVEVAGEEDLLGLMHERLSGMGRIDGWPASLRTEIASAARGDAACELVRGHELVSVLDALARESIRPILLKGTALAYSVYNTPSARPRSDTDLIVSRDQVDCVRRTMARLGYSQTVQCDGELLFCQFEVQKTDAFGVVHAFDVHWKISTQSVFANLLTYEELAAEAAGVPALGPHARMVGPVHALLLACMHPVMHHRNVERLIWVCDVHLLASRLSDDDFARFAKLAVAKQVAAIAAHELSLARARLGTHVPDGVFATLKAHHRAEPSAAYLRPDRRWHDELASSLRGLQSWSERARLLREVLLPNPSYVLARSRTLGRPAGTALLPALYVRRLVRGVAKVLAGRK